MKDFTDEEIKAIRHIARELGFTLHGSAFLQTVADHSKESNFTEFANHMNLAGYNVKSYSNGHFIFKL